MYFKRFGVVKKVLRQSHAFNHEINNDHRRIMLFLNEDISASDISGFMTASGRNCSSKKRLFSLAGAIVNIFSMKTFHINREMRSSNLQPNITKIENSRISLKLPQSRIRMQKSLPKITRWSKAILLQDSQPCRRVVLKQCRVMESNYKVTIRPPAMRLSNSGKRQYRGKKRGRPTKQLLATKSRKLLQLLHPPTPIQT